MLKMYAWITFSLKGFGVHIKIKVDLSSVKVKNIKSKFL